MGYSNIAYYIEQARSGLVMEYDDFVDFIKLIDVIHTRFDAVRFLISLKDRLDKDDFEYIQRMYSEGLLD